MTCTLAVCAEIAGAQVQVRGGGEPGGLLRAVLVVARVPRVGPPPLRARARPPLPGAAPAVACQLRRREAERCSLDYCCLRCLCRCGFGAGGERPATLVADASRLVLRARRRREPARRLREQRHGARSGPNGCVSSLRASAHLSLHTMLYPRTNRLMHNLMLLLPHQFIAKQ